MEGQDNGGVSIKDLPIYSWHNKEEGKEEYARFAKQFKIHLKHLRYLLEPGGVGSCRAEGGQWWQGDDGMLTERPERRER